MALTEAYAGLAICRRIWYLSSGEHRSGQAM